MPDSRGRVVGIERKTWGILGRPPRGWERSHPDLIERWRKLAEEAKQVMRMPRGPVKVGRAKDIEQRRAHLVRDMELNIKLLTEAEPPPHQPPE